MHIYRDLFPFRFHLFTMWRGERFPSVCADHEKSGKLSSTMSFIFASVCCPWESDHSLGYFHFLSCIAIRSLIIFTSSLNSVFWKNFTNLSSSSLLWFPVALVPRTEVGMGKRACEKSRLRGESIAEILRNFFFLSRNTGTSSQPQPQRAFLSLIKAFITLHNPIP